MTRYLLLAFCLTGACGFRDASRSMDEDILADEALASAEEDPTQLKAVRQDPPVGTEVLVEDLASKDLSVRGQAIVALGQLSDPGVDGLLLAIQDDTSELMLVRTWAAAARIGRCKTLDEVLGFAPLLRSMPGLERPLKLKVEATAGDLDNVSSALQLIAVNPEIGVVLSDAVLAAGAGPLMEAMLTGPSEVRMQAAGYLATLGQTDKSAAEAVVEGLRFEVGARSVPWKGGPLYVPSISYRGDQARLIVGGLITWYLFADEAGDAEARGQAYNNLQSVGLIRTAGVDWFPNEPTELLKTWGQAEGPEAIEKILAELGLKKDSRYSAVVKALR